MQHPGQKNLTTATAAALLGLIVGMSPLFAHDFQAGTATLFEFSAKCKATIGPGYVEGLVASDGSTCRIAIYWMEPEFLRRREQFFCFSDFIFSEKTVRYWLDGMQKYQTYYLLEDAEEALVPEQASQDSVVRSALAIVGRVGPMSQRDRDSLGLASFFHEGRSQRAYTYETPSDPKHNEDGPNSASSDPSLLNHHPLGWKYVKQIHDNGALLWFLQESLTERPLIHLVVRPGESTKDYDDATLFDPNTLGDWSLIPEPYRDFWAFREALTQQAGVADGDPAHQGLYDRIDAYLNQNELPAHVCRAMNRLRFKAALATDNKNYIAQSVQAHIVGLCNNTSVPPYQCLLQLARCDGDVRKRSSEMADALLASLLAPVVERAGHDAARHLSRLLPTLHRNNWLTYGERLLGEINRQGLVPEETTADVASRIKEMRLLREKPAPDTDDLTATVQRYLAQLDRTPRQGAIDVNTLRRLLETACVTQPSQGTAGLEQAFAAGVIHLLKRLAGDGPFYGDRSALAESLASFVKRYREKQQGTKHLQTTLATLLALSFCDISTAQDHQLLISQVGKTTISFQSQVNAMLRERGLGDFIAPGDVESVCRHFVALFERHVRDPIVPMFKYPLSKNEASRLEHKLATSILELSGLLEETALKVKYGGGTDRLKKRTLHGIHYAVERILVNVAFQRIPRVNGISGAYSSRTGLTLVIADKVFGENRADDRVTFNELRYFHLGHVIAYRESPDVNEIPERK